MLLVSAMIPLPTLTRLLPMPWLAETPPLSEITPVKTVRPPVPVRLKVRTAPLAVPVLSVVPLPLR